MDASPAARFRWDMTRRWQAWAKEGDLIAIQADAVTSQAHFQAHHRAGAMAAAARAGHWDILAWFETEQWVPADRAWRHGPWVGAAVRAKQWAVVERALTQNLEDTSRAAFAAGLLRARKNDLALPEVARVPMFSSAGMALFGLAIRSADERVKATALERAVGHAHQPGLWPMMPRTVRDVIKHSLRSGRPADAHRLLMAMTLSHGVPDWLEPCWACFDQWLSTRSARIQLRWSGQTSVHLPQTYAALRQHTVAAQPAALSRPRHRA